MDNAARIAEKLWDTELWKDQTRKEPPNHHEAFIAGYDAATEFQMEAYIRLQELHQMVTNTNVRLCDDLAKLRAKLKAKKVKKPLDNV